MMNRLTQPEVKYGLIFIIWTLNLARVYLTYREWKLLKKTTFLPNNRYGYTRETLSKARRLGMEELMLYMVFLLFNAVTYSLVVGFEVVSQFWELSVIFFSQLHSESNDMLVGAFLVVCLTTMDFFSKLPFDLFEEFIILKRYNMNEGMSLGRYLSGTVVIYLFVNGALDFLNVIVVTYTEELGGRYYSMFLWLIDLMGSSVLQIFIVSVLPLALNMHDFRPLPAGELRDSVKQFADSVDFTVQDIYVATPEASRMPNALFFGIGNYKAIVLSDRLLTELDNKEILALLAHELGHWSNNHVLVKFANEQVYSFFSYMTAQYILSLDIVYEAFRIPHVHESAKPAGLGFYVIFYFIFVPVDYAFEVIQNYLSRRHEYQADSFVARAGLWDSFQTGMVKLGKRDLEFPVADPLFAAMTMNHPTLTERLKRLHQDSPKTNAAPAPAPAPASAPAPAPAQPQPPPNPV